MRVDQAHSSWICIPSWYETKAKTIVLVVQLVGSGSEMILDVAPGVDWGAICAIMMCVQQVCSCQIPLALLPLVCEVCSTSTLCGQNRRLSFIDFVHMC